jgi:hypothetical protein
LVIDFGEDLISSFDWLGEKKGKNGSTGKNKATKAIATSCESNPWVRAVLKFSCSNRGKILPGFY